MEEDIAGRVGDVHKCLDAGFQMVAALAGVERHMTTVGKWEGMGVVEK